ncbi:hypothetical protein [Polynucleobacter sp. JS-Polo-80-F4]|uniref:hypothetical protein n=1 Tax=Polynucleobacter sp. JS-Polo-80-F4 TaxID=2576918 RepID=UPI001C0B30F0|nr:hypothetical protein [Polynucleobacter sp. JS-Polo-80-F4]MBU3616749.1 hypothetical protein [Polynucleobacter sp. JS-Polo-80-F4]
MMLVLLKVAEMLEADTNKGGLKIEVFIQPQDFINGLINPSSVVETASLTPPNGTIKITFVSSFTQSNENHLEIPSIKWVGNVSQR